MKITETIANPTVSAMETAAFGMQSSGKMFKMVISGLYSNKAQSITREIWSNAFDAHAMAGKEDVPFDVTLPSRWKSEFVVRDYGEGLSHEWMKQKYTIVGYSSKENTNTAVGKWGVGRMSPLSYIDTFTVVSVHKGKKATYNVTMAADGAPQLNTLIPPMKTDEPSGLRISFPVKPEDYREFVAAAKRVSLGLKVKPLVDGSEYEDWPKLEVASSGNGYSIYTKEYDTPVNGVLAQMGCVLYPIDLTLCGIEYQDKILFEGMNLLLEVPIGSVEVTASREDLSYGSKEPTAKYLRERLMKVRGSLTKDLQKIVLGLDTEYEAYRKVRSPQIPYHLRDHIKFNGKVITKGYSIPCGFDTYTKDYRGAKKGFMSVANSFGDDNLYTNEYEGIIVAYKNGPDKDVRIDTRIRSYVKGNTGVHRWILCICEWDKTKKEYDTTAFEAAQKFFKLPVIKVSSMSDAGPATRKASKAKVYDFNWDEVEVDMEDGGVYVKSYAGSVQGINWTPSFGALKCCKGKTQVIVNKTLWKKFDDHPDWTDVTQAIKDEVKSRKDELDKLCALYYLSDRLNLRHIKDVGTRIKQYYETFDRLKAEVAKDPDHDKYPRVLNALGYTVGYKDANVLLEKLEKDILSDYPLLKDRTVYEVKRDLSSYTNYILAVDFMKKHKG